MDIRKTGRHERWRRDPANLKKSFYDIWVALQLQNSQIICSIFQAIFCRCPTSFKKIVVVSFDWVSSFSPNHQQRSFLFERNGPSFPHVTIPLLELCAKIWGNCWKFQCVYIYIYMYRMFKNVRYFLVSCLSLSLPDFPLPNGSTWCWCRESDVPGVCWGADVLGSAGAPKNASNLTVFFAVNLV